MAKTLRRWLLLGITLVGLLGGLVYAPIAAAESPDSAALFELHCAGCHPNGSNIIRRGKSLQPKALRRHGVDSVEAIAALITQGKGLMSAYGDRLPP